MATKIKYTFINGEVLEVEAEDSLAAYILLDRLHEENSNRRHRRHTLKIEAMLWEDILFASQWGNPEKELLAHEEYEVLSRVLDGLTLVQQRRLIMRLSGLSCREIARQENVSVQSVAESVEGIRKKLAVLLKHKFDE